MAYAGRPVEGGRPLTLSKQAVDGAVTLAAARLADSGFFADAPRGIAFADGFVSIGPEGAARLVHAREHRARHAYAFPFDGSRSLTSQNASSRASSPSLRAGS